MDLHEAADRPARLVTGALVGGDRRCDGSYPGAVLEHGEVGDPPDVLLAVRPREAQPQGQPRPHLVAVQDHHGESTVPDLGLDEARERALPRRGQPGQPDRELLSHRLRTILAFPARSLPGLARYPLAWSSISSRAVACSQSNRVETNSRPCRAMRCRRSRSSTSRASARANAPTSRRGATMAVRPSSA